MSRLPAQDTAAADKDGSIIVKDYLGKERTLYDGDGDGWDDLWCALHPDLKHRNRATDTDGDKLTDYEEMILWRDPCVEGPIPQEPTPEEIAEAKEAAAKSLVLAQKAWEAKKQLLLRRWLSSFPSERRKWRLHYGGQARRWRN